MDISATGRPGRGEATAAESAARQASSRRSWSPSDDVTRGKPDPDPFLAAAEALGVEPARCLVVEDSAAGLTAGR
jgi:sugar-phosphatase